VSSALAVFEQLQRLRIIDLTQPLHSKIPYWPGAGYGAFRYERINILERDGKAAGVFEMPEHMGTHVDAPNHFVASTISVDLLPLGTLLRPAVVFDISARSGLRPGALLADSDVLEWEDQYGRIVPGAVALVRSGWASRWTEPAAFRNDSDGVMSFPAVSREAARLLIEDRGVVGIGVDTLSADNGEAINSPCHHVVHGAGGYILENLANLEQLPVYGAFVLIAPLPIVGGTGAPARVLAFCEREE